MPRYGYNKEKTFKMRLLPLYHDEESEHFLSMLCRHFLKDKTKRQNSEAQKRKETKEAGVKNASKVAD